MKCISKSINWPFPKLIFDCVCVLAAINIAHELNQTLKPAQVSSLKKNLMKVSSSFGRPSSGQQQYQVQHSLVQEIFNDCFVLCWISMFINTKFFIFESGRGNCFQMRKFPQKRHQAMLCLLKKKSTWNWNIAIPIQSSSNFSNFY